MGSVMGVGDKMFLPVLLLCDVLSLVSSHGNMVLRYTWHDKDRVGLGGRVGCEIVELPDYQEDYTWPTIHGTHVCVSKWFTNNTFIPGEPTIPENMLGEGGHDSNPWFAPGTAPVFSPCGTYGGNLHGCRNDRVEKFGDCCSETRCGGFALGSNAETFTYPEAAVTEWTRGSVEEVAWRERSREREIERERDRERERSREREIERERDREGERSREGEIERERER